MKRTCSACGSVITGIRCLECGTLTSGRLELYIRPEAWRRLDEWIFARQLCDEGCIVLDIAFVCLTWRCGKHVSGCDAQDLPL